MANFLQKIAIDWKPAEQSTQAFVNKIIAEIARIQKLPLTQQRSELSSGAQAITSRVQALGATGAIDPREVERTLAQTLAPIKTAQEGVSSSLVEVQAARRTEAANIRRQTTTELAASSEFAAAKAEDAVIVKKMEQAARASAAEMLEADDEYILSRKRQAQADQQSRAKTAEMLAADDDYIVGKAGQAKSSQQTRAKTAEVLAVDDEYIAAKVAYAKALGLTTAQTAQLLAADAEVIAARSGQANAAQLSKAKVAEELAVDDEFIAAKVAEAKAAGLIAAQTGELLAADDQVIYARAVQAKSAGLSAAQTAALLAADDEVIAAKIAQAKTAQLSRAKTAEELAVDDEVIAAKGSLAASNRQAALETRALGLGIPPRGVAAGGAAAETAEAYESRIVTAERLVADRQKLANSKALAKISAEEVAIEAETAALERARQREVNLVTQSLIAEKIENGEIAAGTAFQRYQMGLASRRGGPVKLPQEYQTLGQFTSSKFLTTAGFALSGAAFYGAYTGLKQVFSSEKDVQQAFTIIDNQMKAIGQGGQLTGVRRELQGIAGDTGTAEALIAQVFPQIEGAFHNTRIALEDARTASEVAKITKTDLAATVNSLLPASVAFGVNFEKISDTALGIQERAGVSAKRTIELFGALGPVAAQAGLSLKEVGAIAAAVLQDTTRAPANVAEDLNRLIPQLQTRTPLIYQALQSAGQGATGSEFVKDINAGKTGAAIGLLITAYNHLSAAQQQALEVATGSGRGTKDIIDLLLNQKVALDELNPALSDAGKTSKYFSDLQKDLGQQASQVKEQLLQLGRAVLESGVADGLGDVLVGVGLLVHGLADVATLFADANRLSHGFLGQLLEIAVAAKALQIILKSDTFARIGTGVLNKIPGLGRPDGAHYPGSAPKGPEVEFASAVNEAGQTFLATITKASETVATAMSGGAEVAKDDLAAGGEIAKDDLIAAGTQTAAELDAGGADAAAALAAGGAAGGTENATGGLAGGALVGSALKGGAGLGADVTLGSLGGPQGLLAALAGYIGYKGASSLLGSPNHPNAAGRFEDRVLNDTLGQVTDLHFGGEKYKSPIDDKGYDQVHAAISDLGHGLQDSTGGALSNDEEKRIAKDLKAAKSKNIDVVLASIKDLNAIYADLNQRNPAAAAAAKTAQVNAGNQSQLTPDAQGVVPLTANVDNALAGYAAGTDTLAGAISAAQQKLAGLPAADPRVKAAQDKVNKVISDAYLQDQQLAESLQDNSVAGQQASIAREVALFNLPQFSDPADRLALAKTVVQNLKSELTAEADAATSTQERNRILAAGIAIPPEVRQAIGQQIVDTDPLLQQLLTIGSTLNKSITDAITKDTVNVVAGGKAVGDAYIFALQQELQFLTDMLKVPRYIRGLNENNDQILGDIAKVQGDLDAATANRSALNIQQGVPTTVTGPPKSKADTLSQQDALAKAQADLFSAKAGNDKVQQAKIAQSLADQDLKAARDAKDDVKVAQALAAKERANQQLAAAYDEVAAAGDALQAARDANDPIQAARDAQKAADDQAAVAKRTHDTVGAINSQIAQLAAGRQLAKAMSDLGTAQMNLVKAQLEASGDVVGASKEQVTIIQAQIADFLKANPGANLGNSAELNNLQAQLVSAQTDVGKTTTSFAEQQIQDNLDLKRITTGQAVAQLRALEDLQTNQHDRDEIEKKVRALLGSTGDLKMNLPSDILPTLYEARRLNGVATGSTYQGGTVDNRTQTFVFDGSDLQAVQRVVAAEVGSGSSRFGSTPRRY